MLRGFRLRIVMEHKLRNGWYLDQNREDSRRKHDLLVPHRRLS